MEIDLTKLVETLSDVSENDLNSWLDARDQNESFESRWIEAHESSPDMNHRYGDGEILHSMIWDATNGHEITLRVVEDFDLIDCYTSRGLEHPFVASLMEMYLVGVFPLPN